MEHPEVHGAQAKYIIRHAATHDAAEIARLLTVLEHPTTQAEITGRWERWAAQGNAGLVAARGDGTLAAFCQMHQMLVLHRPRPVGRITALVVDSHERGHGIGRALVAAAEAELAVAGCGVIEITSNLRRTSAHAFYERLGYVRTSVRLARTVAE